MKTRALNVIKEKIKTLNNKCHELTDEVLTKVSGGFEYNPDIRKDHPTGRILRDLLERRKKN